MLDDYRRIMPDFPTPLEFASKTLISETRATFLLEGIVLAFRAQPEVMRRFLSFATEMLNRGYEDEMLLGIVYIAVKWERLVVSPSCF